MNIVVTHLLRGVRAEFIRTGGRGFLWLVAAPLSFVLPLLVSFGIAYVAERFARIPGQLHVTSVTTGNSVYWVISLSVTVLLITATYAQASAGRGDVGPVAAYLLPRGWVGSVARWICYGIVAAALCFVLLVLLMAALPRLFPLVYGDVALASAAGMRFLWSVPLYAFLACGIGVAVGSVIRMPVVAVALVLFWVLLFENSVALLPNGYEAQGYMPFLNAVAGTGQEIAFMPRWEQNGSLLYFAFVTAVIFVLCACVAGIRDRGVALCIRRDKGPDTAAEGPGSKTAEVAS